MRLVVESEQDAADIDLILDAIDVFLGWVMGDPELSFGLHEVRSVGLPPGVVDLASQLRDRAFEAKSSSQ